MRDMSQYICLLQELRFFSENVCAFSSAVYAAFVISAVLDKMKAMVYKREVPAIQMKEAQPFHSFSDKSKAVPSEKANCVIFKAFVINSSI